MLIIKKNKFTEFPNVPPPIKGWNTDCKSFKDYSNPDG